jgi:hypothetical protein
MNEKRGRQLLKPWINAATATGEPALRSFVNGLRADQNAVPNGLSLPGVPAPPTGRAPFTRRPRIRPSRSARESPTKPHVLSSASIPAGQSGHSLVAQLPGCRTRQLRWEPVDSGGVIKVAG